MKFSKVLICVFTMCILASLAMADEVDFYNFRTKHSPEANRNVKFKIEVLETSAVNSNIDRLEKYSCHVRPNAPTVFGCGVRGNTLVIEATEAGVRAVLRSSDAVRADEIIELKEKSRGVFQALLKGDRIFHVVINAPVVADDSMECELSVIGEKNLGMIRCRSEFFTDNKFMVRDIPLSAARERGMVVFGPTIQERYGNASNEWKKQNAEAIAKVREVLTEMAKLKKKPLVENIDSAVNFSVDTSGDSKKLLGVNSYNYYDYSWHEGRTAISNVELSGSVEHIHRGLNGRKGD